MSPGPGRARLVGDDVCGGVRVRGFVGLFAPFVLSFLFFAAGTAGCAHAVVAEPRADGTVRLRCKTPLPACLNEGAANVCHGAHYVVLRAVDELNQRGTTESPMDDRTSGAIIRCGEERGWGPLGKPLEDLDKLDPTAPPPGVSPAPVAGSACVPGETRLCVGPAACRGGQACLAGGAAFGPCDCGPSPVPVHP